MKSIHPTQLHPPSPRPERRKIKGFAASAISFLAALGLAEAAPLKLDFASNALNTASGWTPVTGITLGDTMVNITGAGGTSYNFTFNHVACWDNGQAGQPLTRSGFYNFGQLGNNHDFTLSGLNAGQSVKLYASAGWDGNGKGGYVLFGDNAPTGVKAQTVGNPGTAPTLANLTYIGTAIANGSGVVTGSLNGSDGVGTASEGQVGGFLFFPAPIITASAGANGSITPTGAVEVPGGDDKSFTITANSGYHVADVLVDGASVGAVTNYTFSAVEVNHTISASFAVNTSTHTITASAGAHGSISPSGSVTVNHGVNSPFTITPEAGYHVADVLVDGASVGAVTNYTFTNVVANHTVNVSFALNSYSITASAGAHGSISPAGTSSVSHGSSLQYTFTPDPGYQVAEVFVDNVPVSSLDAYSFDEVTANHTISATFDNRTRLYLDFTNVGGNSVSTWTPVYANYVADTAAATASDINGLGYAFSINHVGAYDNGRAWEPMIRSGFYTFGPAANANDHTFTLTGLNAGQTVTLYASAAWDGNAAGGYVVFGDSGANGVKAQTVGEPSAVPVLANMTVIGTATADGSGTVTGSLHGRTGVNTNLEGQVGGFVFAINPGGTSVSPYAAWSTAPPNSLSGNAALPASDPDGDGVSNLMEFALNGSPITGASSGRSHGRVAYIDGTSDVLTLTIAVRENAVFSPSGNRMVSAPVDGVTYTVEASASLGTWGDRAVTEVTGDDASLIQSEFPAPDAGWVYKTFRTAGNAGTNAHGFIRAGVQ
ncbi:InlB B-repeat-containing protein [Luteolibacter soli]|uniref:Uncharacterized protein n=1 Tax=Luteolibacter soli TaxID=3135280 RepID=A0ABU9AZH2_9BACT